MNKWTVKGSEEQLASLLEYTSNGKEPISLSKILPAKSDSARDQTRAWGIKWELTSVDLIKKEGQYVFTFVTPWNPPYPSIFYSIAMRFGVTFTYLHAEQGMGILGKYEEKGLYYIWDSSTTNFIKEHTDDGTILTDKFKEFEELYNQSG